MSKRLIVRVTAGIVCGVIALAAVAGWIEWQRRTEPLRPVTYAGEPWRGNSLNIPLRWCPAGNFVMGSPATEPGRGDNEDQVNVTLAHGFWLGQTEVTKGQWQRVMGTTPWRGKGDVSEGVNHPAVFVSHSGDADSAVAFCEKFTARERAAGRLPAGWIYRLPTEAEWEYACRAGTTTAYNFGDDPAKLSRYAWFEGNSKWHLSGTKSWLEDPALYAHPVGTKLANGWGLRDMQGSVWEWCADTYEAKIPGGTDPENRSKASYRVFRGGSWNDTPADCRSAYRNGGAPGNRNDGLGFRIALSRVRDDSRSKQAGKH